MLPTSDVGPFLLDGQTWYVWDVGTGSYIPQVIPAESLRYIAQNASPDHLKYIFWIQLDGSGKAQSIQYYFSGAWHDIYEDKFATYSTTSQMNTAIAAAVAGIPPPSAAIWYPFRVEKSIIQDVTFGGAGNQTVQINFDVEVIDPNLVYALNRFTVPALKGGAWQIGCSVEMGVTAGSPTQTDFAIEILVNGNVKASQILPINSTDDRIYNISTMLSLGAGDEVTVQFNGTSDAACTLQIGNDSDTCFWGRLVQVI